MLPICSTLRYLVTPKSKTLRVNFGLSFQTVEMSAREGSINQYLSNKNFIVFFFKQSCLILKCQRLDIFWPRCSEFLIFDLVEFFRQQCTCFRARLSSFPYSLLLVPWFMTLLVHIPSSRQITKWSIKTYWLFL